MNMTRRDFWTEALKGGTLIGLITVAFSLLTQTAGERATLVEILGYASTIITILLLAGYLRRFARMHSRAEGFSYGRGVGFVVAMMLFVGVLSGVYSAVMTNFFIKEEILASVDAAMAQYQDMIPAENFEQTYDLMRASVTNPLMLTISSVISNALYGLVLGLLLAIPNRRQPDIFAPEENKIEDAE